MLTTIDKSSKEFKRDIENQIWKMLKALEIPCFFFFFCERKLNFVDGKKNQWISYNRQWNKLYNLFMLQIKELRDVLFGCLNSLWKHGWVILCTLLWQYFLGKVNQIKENVTSAAILWLWKFLWYCLQLIWLKFQ